MGASTGGGIIDLSSWLNTEVYCLFRMSALSLALEISSPFSLKSSGDVPVRYRFDALVNFQNLFGFCRYYLRRLKGLILYFPSRDNDTVQARNGRKENSNPARNFSTFGPGSDSFQLV